MHRQQARLFHVRLFQHFSPSYMPEEIAVCNPWLDVSGVNIPVGFVKVESVFIAQMLVCDTGNFNAWGWYRTTIHPMWWKWMMALSHWEAPHITGPWWGKSTDHECFPHMRIVMWIYFMIVLAWISYWIHSRIAGDLRRHYTLQWGLF